MAEKYSPYPEYKYSNDKWLGDVPATWCVARFKHGIELIESGKRESVDFSDVLSIGGEHIGTDGCLRLENLKYVSRDFYERSKKGRVNKGDTLVVKDGATIGKTAFVDSLPKQRMLLNEHVYRIESTKFFYFYILSKFFQAEIWSKNTSSAQEGLNLSTINNIPALIPSAKEQKQIAAFLDYETAKIDTLIEKQQQLIGLLGEKRQAVISHAVTKGLNPDAPMRDSGIEWLGEVPEHWKIWKFGHFAPIITCGVASTPTYVDEDEGMPFLSAQNIRQNRLSLHKYNFIPHALHNQLTKYRRPLAGDILVTRVGAGIGDACVVDTDMEFSIYVSLTHIRVEPSIAVNTFIKYFFSSDYCKFLNFQGTVTGGGVGNLNVQNVEKYKIPLPTPEEQTQIADYLDHQGEKFNELILNAEAAMELLQERRTALISAAVTGKIDVRGWKRPSAAPKKETEMEVA